MTSSGLHEQWFGYTKGAQKKADTSLGNGSKSAQVCFDPHGYSIFLLADICPVLTDWIRWQK